MKRLVIYGDYGAIIVLRLSFFLRLLKMFRKAGVVGGGGSDNHNGIDNYSGKMITIMMIKLIIIMTIRK